MENPEYMREVVRSGVDFSKAQLNEIWEATKAERPVEFETFSPYVADHDLANGDIHTGGLTNEEQIALAIGKVLREKLPEARMISLYDEYNTNVPDATDVYGKPVSEGRQLQLSDEVKNNFKQSIQKLLQERGLSRPDDLLISESSKITAAEDLAARLTQAGLTEERDGALYFKNPNPENPEYQEVLLKTKGGRWMCEALDASTYLDPKNLETTHLVVLSNHFKSQQDKVWEILRSLGIKNKKYHNIFYDENLPPDAVAEYIREQLDAAREPDQSYRTAA